MAGYRRVNYYELCRLCTSSEGTKMHIFREEGRRRQLPTKIQICLPLQVCEDDSLPKIICSHCVDKLESFYDFRESCVNAEAMLESYFTSLRYSNDFTREGKQVYVKDESPPKKKAAVLPDSPEGKLLLKPMMPDGLNSMVHAQGIQIVTDEDGTRVQQYKCQVQMAGPGSGSQSTVLEAAEARYSYEPCNSQRTADMAKEDGSTQCSENDFNAKAIARQQNQTPESSDGDLSNQQQPITFSTSDPTANQMLLHFNFKDRADPDQQVALQRSSMAQIGEFLRIKSVNLEVPSVNNPVIVEAPAALMQAAVTTRINCDRCLKQYTSLEDFQNHPCLSPDPHGDGVGGLDPDCDPDGDMNGDKHGGGGDPDGAGGMGAGGPFACEICAKPFKRKEHLFQHRKLHTGERPYVCVACGKAFSRKEHLVRHAVSHTGQKTHACDLCGKTFSRKDNLHKHRKTHGIAGPYICETCGKSFVVKHYYMMHKNSHAANPSSATGGAGGEDPLGDPEASPPPSTHAYKCDVCGKAFTTKSYLSSHKLRHKKALAKYEVVSEAQQLLSRLTDGQHLLSASSNQPLTTINNAALLAPSMLHHGAGEMAQQAAYLCAPTTVAASELIETYRRLHST